LTEHLRLNGVYWGLTTLHLLGHPDALPRDKTIEFVIACQNKNGGFGAAPGHDSHMLYTVSAVQLLATLEALDVLDDRGGKEHVGKCENLPNMTSWITDFDRHRWPAGHDVWHLCG
jgi:geranylgeranyl transferase type-2 subunit beta